MGRPFRILLRLSLLPGLIVLLIALLAGIFVDFSGAPPDYYPYLDPLVRLGWGLLALGELLFIPLARILRRRHPRASAYTRAWIQQRYRHPRWARGATIWLRLVMVTILAVLALAPRDLLISWLQLVDPTTDARYSGLVVIGAVLVSGAIAFAPRLALRRFDRPR
jgi:hypothetical protein